MKGSLYMVFTSTYHECRRVTCPYCGLQVSFLRAMPSFSKIHHARHKAQVSQNDGHNMLRKQQYLKKLSLQTPPCRAQSPQKQAQYFTQTRTTVQRIKCINFFLHVIFYIVIPLCIWFLVVYILCFHCVKVDLNLHDIGWPHRTTSFGK